MQSTATITTKHDITDMLTRPEKYVDAYEDVEFLILPDERAAGGIVRFSIGKDEDTDGFYIVSEDDDISEDFYPSDDESLLHTFVRVLNESLVRVD